MLTLESIAQICDSIGGLNEIYITDPRNMSATDTPVDPFIFYKIEYNRFSGSYNESSNRDEGGDYVDQTMQFSVPVKRAAVQTMIRRCSNRRIAVSATLRSGEKVVISEGRFTYEYNTGSELSDDEGYKITIKGKKLNKGYKVVNGNASPNGNNLVVPGDTTTVGTVPIGNETSQLSAECCVTIQTSPLLYIPPLSGNDTLKNMFVIGSDGNKYFIDSQGVSMKVDSDVKRHRVEGPTEDTVFTLPWLVVDPTKDLIVFRNGNFSKYNPPPSDIDQHGSDGTTAQINPAFPLEAGEFIDFIKLQ
jgi:hypothetical protein